MFLDFEPGPHPGSSLGRLVNENMRLALRERDHSWEEPLLPHLAGRRMGVRDILLDEVDKAPLPDFDGASKPETASEIGVVLANIRDAPSVRALI
jgi:hypothetical protein